MSASIKLVLFDMEGVLTHYDRAARVAYLSKVTGQSGERVRYAIWGSGLEARADAGEITDDDYLRELGILLTRPVTRDEWLAARRASSTPNPDVIALAARVAKRCRIAVLTNNCRLVTDNMAYLNAAVAQCFGPHVYASAAFGAAKPAARAYLGCLEALGALPHETLFIDDAQANVQGAADAGLHAFRFDSVDALKARLISSAVL